MDPRAKAAPAEGTQPASPKKIEEAPQTDPWDEALDESFPASDPPSWSPPPRPRVAEPSGRSTKIDPVEESSQESFPASDAPSWTLGIEPRRKTARSAGM